MHRYRVYIPEVDFRITVRARDAEEAAEIAVEQYDSGDLEIASLGHVDVEVLDEDTDEVEKVSVVAEISVGYRAEKA
jgi:3'-phosphoadenosine 5'-phosphosulfate sulfotransferase